MLAIGFVVVDILATDLPRLPRPGELLFAPHGIRLWIGGHPANVSVDLVQLGLRDVGVVVPVGEDMLGGFIENFLHSHGVSCYIQRVKEAGTGRTIVLGISGEERSFISDVGANQHLSLSHVESILSEFKPRICYLACGILGEFDYEAWRVLKKAREMDAITFLDVVKPLGKNWDFIHPALPYANILHSNLDELAGITGKKDHVDGLRWLSERGVILPITTSGEHGLTAYFKGRIISQPAFKAKPIDTTGAGDALSAGIITKLHHLISAGKSLETLTMDEVVDMLLFGQAAGAACVEAIGTTAGVKSERVETLIKEQGEQVKSQTKITRQNP